MISIFKTNIGDENELVNIAQRLNKHLPDINWNVDLADCDRILRVESKDNNNDFIESLFRKMGFLCVNLEVFHTAPQ
ncbi:hypothetical protein EZ449_16070 [Pedobacter frigidisoli]|uniref:Uncharacterized protein n=1 Tax=Pedobacter frigidisoli TaxID=2530455 RepID=A0A4R0P094_9SPHI|nr:hypothetical protein [Pedobacter frigidisoli]TCD05606.1 hypothetical protein EZ449_16070 [Pedobacter frigidisoli]